MKFKVRKLILKLLVFLQFRGASIFQILENGNAFLKLNQNTHLGMRGELIQVPHDFVIFDFVKHHGSWEKMESNFLANQLNSAIQQYPQSPPRFLDIGANCGLISRQILLDISNRIQMILVEPIPKHVEAINFNLKKFELFHEIHVITAALTTHSGKGKIFIQQANKGNSSLLQSAMGVNASLNEEVTLIDTNFFVKNFLQEPKPIVMKSDTQGSDAKILSRFPIHIWKLVYAAVVEVWALPEVESADVDALIEILGKQTSLKVFINSECTTEITLDFLADFWKSGSRKSMNIFMISGN